MARFRYMTLTAYLTIGSDTLPIPGHTPNLLVRGVLAHLGNEFRSLRAQREEHIAEMHRLVTDGAPAPEELSYEDDLLRAAEELGIDLDGQPLKVSPAEHRRRAITATNNATLVHTLAGKLRDCDLVSMLRNGLELEETDKDCGRVELLVAKLEASPRDVARAMSVVGEQVADLIAEQGERFAYTAIELADSADTEDERIALLYLAAATPVTLKTIAARKLGIQMNAPADKPKRSDRPVRHERVRTVAVAS